jgi:hypothetical protein
MRGGLARTDRIARHWVGGNPTAYFIEFGLLDLFHLVAHESSFYVLLRRLASGLDFNQFGRDSHRKSGVLSFLALLSPVDSCNPPVAFTMITSAWLI